MPEIINHVPNPAEAAQWSAMQSGQEANNSLASINLHETAAQRVLNSETNLFQHCTTDGQREVVSSVMRTGSDNGYELPDGVAARNEHERVMFRQAMAEMYLQSPGTYEVLRNNKIVGFHGTRSIALAGILESKSLLSAQKLNALEEGPLMASGEHVFQSTADGQGSISFSKIGFLESAAHYAGAGRDPVMTTEQVIEKQKQAIEEGKRFLDSPRLAPAVKGIMERSEKTIKELTENPNSLRATLMRHDFPVMIGINGDFVVHDKPAEGVHRNLVYGQSEMGEFRPFSDEIPLGALPVVAVPGDKVASVKQLFQMHGHEAMEVVPLEDLSPPKAA